MVTDFLQASELFKQAKKVFITVHAHPDGDALGSLCALSNYLHQLNKEVICAVDELPSSFLFLPGINKIILSSAISNPVSVDLVVTLDFSNLKRSAVPAILEKLQQQGVPFINFDHHPFNERFGKINLVDETASSTAAVLWRFFKTNKIVISPDMATGLLTGIMTDTGNLSNAATNLEALSVASELLLLGARFYRINSNTVFNKDLNSLRLWGTLLERLRINEKYGLAYTVVTKADLAKYNLSAEAVEGLSNYLSQLNKVKAVMVLKEGDNGLIHGSLRSVNKNVNVSLLAQKLGGGGHKLAAGFAISGKLVGQDGSYKIV